MQEGTGRLLTCCCSGVCAGWVFFVFCVSAAPGSQGAHVGSVCSQSCSWTGMGAAAFSKTVQAKQILSGLALGHKIERSKEVAAAHRGSSKPE